MNQEDLQNRILMRNHLEQQELEPAAPYTPSTGMSPEEMRRYIRFLFTQLEDIKEELRRANATIAENASEQKRLNALVLSLTNQLNDALQKIQNLLLENESLKSSLRVFKKQRFDSSSQKGLVKKEEAIDRDDDKDDFDGTSASLQTSIDPESIGFLPL